MDNFIVIFVLHPGGIPKPRPLHKPRTFESHLNTWGEGKAVLDRACAIWVQSLGRPPFFRRVLPGQAGPGYYKVCKNPGKDLRESWLQGFRSLVPT